MEDYCVVRIGKSHWVAFLYARERCMLGKMVGRVEDNVTFVKDWCKNLLAALDGLANLNNVKTRRKRLLELLSLLLVVNGEGVEEARASDLELGDLLAIGTGGALDAGSRSILSASDLEEFLDVGDLLRL